MVAVVRHHECVGSGGYRFGINVTCLSIERDADNSSRHRNGRRGCRRSDRGCRFSRRRCERRIGSFVARSAARSQQQHNHGERDQPTRGQSAQHRRTSQCCRHRMGDGVRLFHDQAYPSQPSRLDANPGRPYPVPAQRISGASSRGRIGADMGGCGWPRSGILGVLGVGGVAGVAWVAGWLVAV